MPSATRDLASHQLWERSLKRSRRRRVLAEDARKTISRRRQASLAVSAAMATTPVIPSVIASAMTGGKKAANPTRTQKPNGSQRILLKPGAVSPSVAMLQRKLNIADDGYYGPVTERAVKQFQRTHGLPATGVVDVSTWLKLFPNGMVLYQPHSGVAQLAAQAPSSALREASARTDAGVVAADLAAASQGSAAASAVDGGSSGSAAAADALSSGKGSAGAAKSGGQKSGSRASGSQSSGSSSSSGRSSGSSGRGASIPATHSSKASEMIAAMIAAANRIDAAHYSYSWGGGHNPSFSGPYDCSGAVSAVLHAAGLLSRPMVSGEFMHWGAPGPGAVTIYANAGHVYMSILGRFFGTSSANPGGGAGWFDGAPRPGFVVVHVPFERLGLSKAELSRLVHGTNLGATPVRHHKKKKHRRHRRHGVIQYAPVTPGYTGQAPGTASSSSGSSGGSSSSESSGSSESSSSEASSPPQHETEQAFTPADQQVQASTNETTYGADQASSGQTASDGSAGGSGDWQSSDGSGASSDGSGVASSDGSGASSGSADSSGSSAGTAGGGSSESGSSASGSEQWSGNSGSSGSGSSGSSSSGSSGSGSSGSGSSGATQKASSAAASAGSTASSAANGAESTASSAGSSYTSATESAGSSAGSSDSSGTSYSSGSSGGGESAASSGDSSGGGGGGGESSGSGGGGESSGSGGGSWSSGE